jgi:hypothetical protein
VSIHHSHTYGSSPTYMQRSTSIGPSQVLRCDGKGESFSPCRVKASPPPPPDEAQSTTSYQFPISTVSTARVFTFVSMPCPSRARYARLAPSLPSSSQDVALPSFPRYSYPPGDSSVVNAPPCSNNTGKGAVASLPPDLVLGAAYCIV